MRVLIVEDVAIVAMDLAMVIASFGHEVCGTVASASQAIEQAIRHAPDVILMDVRLNGSSGIDAARELYVHHGLRCIFVSANVDERTRAALQPLQPIDFVDKPVLPLMLKRALEKAQRALSGA